MRLLKNHAVVAGTFAITAVLAAGTAFAQADAGMDAFYAGTLQIQVPNTYNPYFAQRKFSPDHTYVDRESDQVFHGTWAIQDGKICTTRAGAKTFCNVGVGRKIGDAWTDKDPYTGNEVDFSLVAGRPAFS